jgi:F-type H+-transporting ATPase subunit gamma
MGNLRELRGRIKSVGNIKQITRAMEMVATTKLRRFQERALASRPYADEIAGLLGRLAAILGEDLAAGRPLFGKGSGERAVLLLVSSDRGLCGPYNSNLFRALEAWTRRHGDAPVDYYVYGRKGYQYLTRRGREVRRFLVEPPLERIDYRGAALSARALAEAFVSGGARSVHVLSTAFESMVKFTPRVQQLLPIEPTALGALGAGSAPASDVILEPDAAAIFDGLAPRYLETRVYNALLEALTSEYASRRMSMKNATDAAGEMGAVLKSQYNRQRQETITKELLDIVGGAEALRG